MLGLFSTLGVGFALVDAEGRVVWADPAYAGILGRPVARVIGVTVQDVTHPDDLDCNIWLFNQAKKIGGGFDLRKRYRLEDGGVQWVESPVVCLPGLAEAQMFLIACRPIEPPPAALVETLRAADYSSYAADIAGQLAVLVGASRPGLGSELLRLAASVLAKQADAKEPTSPV